MVTATTLIGLLLIGMVVNLLAVYRKSRLLAASQLELKQQKIEDLLTKQEMEQVMARLTGQNTERKRIAQELHDRLGSILFTAKLHYSKIEKGLEQLKARHDNSHAQLTKLLDEATYEVRRISHDLYEGSLARFGYVTALSQLVKAIMTANPLLIHFDDHEVEEKIYKDFQEPLYRITQELLSNTLKHSSATEVHISFDYTQSIFTFTYQDDGEGFDLNTENKEGLGLESIRQRAVEMEAELSFSKELNEGMCCQLKIEINA
jgi:signal transduction histidine kinase